MIQQIDSYGRITNLLQSLSRRFTEIENPSRYIPSEYILNNKHFKPGDFKCAMCFPDLYEIGMSNNAVRILFDLMNRMEGVVCDRVFAVAPDFEKLLRETKTTLFTLNDNIAVNHLDFLGITIGCELLATNILQILDLSGIALDVKDRKETDPVVIAGGPAATNPLPFSKFFDFIYIGEAESGLQDIILEMKKYKTRSERIKALKSFPFLWYPGKEKAYRAMDNSFGTEIESPLLKHYAVPAFQVSQDHGTVEIMRGCPNGCRFCHAGQYYKPFRQRNLDTVYELVKQNVEQFGYREITLSSLSSGDYPELDKLIDNLNGSFKDKSISFSLPSLRVSTFALNILDKISEVRKSGLTFAIETPVLDDQRSMNKEVPVENVVSIIQEAKSKGWRVAKFYFMVGLPFTDREKELENIVSYLKTVWDNTRINMNINIGTFIPKAHTPFQWAKQMSMEESEKHLKNIKRALMAAVPGIKVSYHEPSISFLEGIISRGGYECADLIEKAYRLGCRLDAWDEYIKWDLWQKAMEDLSYDTEFRGYDLNQELPWDSVSLNISKTYLKKQYELAKEHKLTSVCGSDCDHNCGVCGKKAKTITADNTEQKKNSEKTKIPTSYNQVIFTYSKTGKAVFCSHISTMRQFEMAFQRAGLDVKFTEGFNPKPKMEFLNPISLGVTGLNELLLCELPEGLDKDSSLKKLNNSLAEGFEVKNMIILPKDPTGKKISLTSHFKGSVWTITNIENPQITKALDDYVQNDGIKIAKTNTGYEIATVGEKNIFKTIFGPEMSKFAIAGSSTITREKVMISLD